MKIDLIEKLGGYGRAKDALELPLNYGFTDDEINKALLQYRREHNIFEVGDNVVFKKESRIGGASDAIDLMTVQSVDAFGVRMTNSVCPWAIQIRHATPEEIQAGRRLEVCGG